MGYAYMWEFDVAAGREREFEQHYGPDGSWVQLFRKAVGYRGTVLLEDRAAPGRYITIDRWSDAQAFETFRATFAAEYEQLDRDCEQLTVREQPLGVFEDFDGASAP